MNNYILTKKKQKYWSFIINFEYDKEIVKRVKKIPTARFYSKSKEWHARVSPETAPHIYKLITDYGFEATDHVYDRVKGAVVKRKEMYKLSTAQNSDIELPEFPGSLKPYNFQKPGVEYMLKTKRCFNGDDMGTGKTIQTMIAMEMADAYPHIVICPAVAKKKWRKEIHKWLPHRSCAILDDLNFSYQHDIMILNYEAVLKYLIREIPDPDGSTYLVREAIKMADIKGLTCDECHYLKNPSSKRTQAVKKLSKQAEYIWMLSGTIIENRPKELISQLQIMRRLNDFGGYSHFIKRYCDAEMEWHGHMNKDGSSNLGELNTKLRQTCMIRRMKSDVLKELPPKTEHNIKINIDNRDEYDLAENDIFMWMEKERRRKRGNELELEGDIDKEVEKTKFMEKAIELQVINALKLITARGKLEGAIKWIKKFTKSGEKLIVFANHIEIQQGILKEFPMSARILGGMSPAERQKNENLFQNDDRCKIVVCSLKAANMAIDLFAAANVLTVELGWTPSVHDQAGDRAWRIGQTRHVRHYFLLGKGTIDEDIYDLLVTKKKVVEASLDGTDDDANLNILDDLIERLKEKGKLKIPTK